MRRFLTAAALLILGTPAAAHSETDSLTVERLAALGRIWGTAKFFHPALAYRDVDWDAALIRAIPAVEAARDDLELSRAVDAMLLTLGDPYSRCWPAASEEDENEPEPPAPEPPGVVRESDGIVRLVATDWPAFQGEGGASLEELFAECREAEGIVLDLRNRADGSGTFAREFEAALPTILSADLMLPAERIRFHSGYAPQSGRSSGGYSSSMLRREHRTLSGTADAPPPPIVALVSDHTAGISHLLAALQTAGLAVVVQDGDDPPWGSARWSHISLTDTVEASVSVEEAVNADGTVGLRADYVADASGATGGDPAHATALRVLRGDADPPAARTPPPPPRWLREETYADAGFPSRELRLLGLFRMWHVIRLFYPYHDLLDEPWDATLEEFLPRFLEAETRLDYALAARELAARMQDSHANVWSRDFSPFGKADPSIVARRIEGRWIVHGIADAALADRVAVGDVIVSVDGEPSEERARRQAPFMPASTPQALDWRIAKSFLGGEEGSEAELELEKEDGSRATVKLPREETWHAVRTKAEADPKLPVFTVLPEGFGYIDLDRLERSEVDAALEAVQGTSGLIFDMRGYPQGTAWFIAPRLARKVVTAARFRRPVHEGPEEFDWYFHEFEQKIHPRNPWEYEHPIVVLIDEDAISQAEHTCLHLEAALEGDITFIGTPTNGANGDVSNFPIPGGFTVGFTGHDVRHGDGRQLQRVGVQPDIFVAPTIEGIRRGEDEILAAAIRFLQDAE